MPCFGVLFIQPLKVQKDPWEGIFGTGQTPNEKKSVLYGAVLFSPCSLEFRKHSDNTLRHKV